jgi:hypothetical protein
MTTDRNLGQRTHVLKSLLTPSKTWYFFFFVKDRRESFYKVGYWVFLGSIFLPKLQST